MSSSTVTPTSTQTGPPQAGPTAWDHVRGLLTARRSHLALLGVIAILVLVTSLRSPVFLSWGNFANVLQQMAIFGILAAGTTALMVSGGLDLSIGSNVSFSAMIMGTLLLHHWSPTVAVTVGILAAIGVGLCNGVLAAFSRSHPFILTLGMLTLLQGAALLISNVPITAIPDSMLAVGRQRFAGLPPLVWALLLALVAVHVLLRYSKIGRWIYALGASSSAAYRAGIPVRALKICLYAGNGLLVGVAAFLLMVQLASTQAQMGTGLEMTAIAAVAVGGTPLAGGRGDIPGTILGIILLGLIGNALNLMSIPGELRYVLQGAVIVVAVMAQREK
ncbi:monosaccharide ABC transporter membrane protein (CUT2 family) [Amycolatopsis sulphurea]|uniref:Monosaccharide ABC transporter membrane protein (CUT2 family) n=1 Tax=Amycolatopsis sulphurea TaxID=76022 RepID=A0A2A9FIY6_9PSEU|nr:ABC transporter permease [Amycolatopsis sulphurea]PFG50726.1 monosaccharide ABC transporter membrane protein (CUT2 family) [Amycolatopsis sulphurea]